jgi:hypothetical protein
MKEPKESQEVRLLLTRARNLLSHPGFWVDSPEGQASRLKLQKDIQDFLDGRVT